MTSWQDEIIVTSYGVMTKGEARDYEESWQPLRRLFKKLRLK